MKKRRFVLVHEQARANAAAACNDPQYEGWQVIIKEPTRSDDQNSKFHAMCGDVEKQCTYMGRKLKDWQWKVLFISGHAVATKQDADVLPGLEGEFVNIRESSAQMGVRRMASVITYVQAWGDNQGVLWSKPEREYA